MNPFRELIVSDPWRAAAVDVPEIQKDVFDECLRGVEHVRRAQRSAALLIHGGAGAGKTHLLSRLRTHLTLKAPTATDREECLFVWVRLQASPRMIWRVVRRTLVEDWLRPVRDQRTQFERILFHRLAEIRVAEGDLEPWYEYLLETDPAGLDTLLEQVADNLNLDRNTTIAFKHLAFGRHRRDLRAWLGGDSLPEEVLARLGLSQDEGTDAEREHEARRVTLMLCRLAGDGLPILLSLDQIEALQSTAGDREGLFAFGQLASTLHDETSNVLVVSCVQSAFATELKDKSLGADYDRITSLGARSLATLTRREAAQLIAARLTLIEPWRAETTHPDDSRSDEAHRVSTSRDPLWPLDVVEVERLLATGSLTPRKLLATCAERFEEEPARVSRAKWEAAVVGLPTSVDLAKTVTDPQAAAASEESRSTASIGLTTPEFLAHEWSGRVARTLAESQPERTEEVVRHGLPLAVKLVSPGWQLVRDEQLPDVALVFEGPHGKRGLAPSGIARTAVEKTGVEKTGVAISTQPNMNSVNAQFKRLNSQLATQRLARLILVRDSRVPLSKGAKVARQSLDELERQGTLLAHPSVEVLAALDALRGLLSDAQAGDLAHAGEVVSPSTVEEWLATHLPNDLRQFVEQLASATAATGTPLPNEGLVLEELAALLTQRSVLPIDEVAAALKCSAATVVATARRHPDRFGLQLGPPPLLFRVTGEPTR